MHHLIQRIIRTGGNDTAAKVNCRTLCVVQQLRNLTQLLVGNDRNRTRLNRSLRLKFADSRGDILRDINQNRTWAVALCDFKRLTDGICQLGNVAHDEVMLGNRHGDAGNIDLLEAVASNQRGADVAGDGNHRNGVHVCGRDAGDQIGCTRTGRSEYNTNLTGCACIAICRMGSALLMRRQDMTDAVRILVQLIINIQNCTARIAENRIGTLLEQCLDEDL